MKNRVYLVLFCFHSPWCYFFYLKKSNQKSRHHLNSYN